MARQPPAWVLPGGEQAKAAVRAAHPQADYVLRKYRRRLYPIPQYVITDDGTEAGRRLGPCRMSVNNAWVAAARRMLGEVSE